MIKITKKGGLNELSLKNNKSLTQSLDNFVLEVGLIQELFQRLQKRYPYVEKYNIVTEGNTFIISSEIDVDDFQEFFEKRK